MHQSRFVLVNGIACGGCKFDSWTDNLDHLIQAKRDELRMEKSKHTKSVPKTTLICRLACSVAIHSVKLPAHPQRASAVRQPSRSVALRQT